MTRRFVHCFVAMVGLICVRARGDVAAMPSDPPITNAAKTALDVSSYGDEFAKVGAEVDKLVKNSADKATVSMVRQWLIDEDPPTASNPYQEAYADALNQAFLAALVQPGTSATAKVNVGIIISTLSGPKDHLSPTVTRLLGDSSGAVAMWGERAAGAMLPAALQNKNFNAPGLRDALLAAVVAAVVSHSDGPLAGPIVDDAYRAINPKLWKVNGLVPPADAYSALIDANLKLQAARLALYTNTGIPALPKADTYASYLLLSSDGWNAMNPAQQLQAVQQASNLVSLCGQRAATQAANLNQDVVDALQSEGEWIFTLGTNLADQNIQQVGSAVNKLSAAMPASAIRQACDAVYGALQSNPSFSTIQAPPTIGGASAPKSASDTAAGSTPTSEARP